MVTTVFLFSALVTLQTFISKTGSFRKWSIIFYSFGLKRFGKLNVVGYKLLHFDIIYTYQNDKHIEDFEVRSHTHLAHLSIVARI